MHITKIHVGTSKHHTHRHTSHRHTSHRHKHTPHTPHRSHSRIPHTHCTSHRGTHRQMVYTKFYWLIFGYINKHTSLRPHHTRRHTHELTSHRGTHHSEAGPVRAVVRPGVTSFEGPIGPENTSGGGPLRLARRAPYHTLGPLLYLGARGK